MAPNRLSLVVDVVAEEMRASECSVTQAVCLAACALLGMTGAGIALIADGRLLGSSGATGPGVDDVQALQLALGEGPTIDAWTTGALVLEPALGHPARMRWPAFAGAAADAGVAAVFAFPLQIGVIRIGVMTTHRDRPGDVSSEELARGVVLADVATHVVLALQAGARGDELHAMLAGEPPHWAEIHQATGMVSAQLGVPPDDAFVRLQAHAFADERPLGEVAADVVARRLRLERT